MILLHTSCYPSCLRDICLYRHINLHGGEILQLIGKTEECIYTSQVKFLAIKIKPADIIQEVKIWANWLQIKSKLPASIILMEMHKEWSRLTLMTFMTTT